MANTETVRIHADHSVAKHLGHWTTASRFDVRARRGAVVLDLRSPQIGEPADPIEIHLDVDHAMVKLLVPSDATVETWDLTWTGRGRVKDGERPAGKGARQIRLTGSVASGEIRIHRGGIAILSALFSRAYVEDVRRAHREGVMPTVDDPTRTAI
ncbi:hypothetical protein [Pseudonocardia sp. GCM10023141]|uniref:hypothetical protein n=1 Tax=Pseudonocardia sp. GCM10023141 TaxID=3252653 RepID=UPI003610C8DA